MKKSLFIACLLALCGAFVGCVAETGQPDLPQTSLGMSSESEPGETSPTDSDSEPYPAAAPSNEAEASPYPPETAVGADARPEQQLPYPGDSVETDLQRLQDLDLFEVGELLMAVPGENYSCAYNQPCLGEELDGAVRTQHARLLGLLAIAQDVTETPELPEPTQETQQDLTALMSLSILYVGQLIVDEPANSVTCYNLPCQSDIDEAAASNARRAEVLAALAEQSVDL